MSRASVRSAVSTYLAPPAVAGLNVVLPTQPKDLGGIEFTSGVAGEDSGAIATLFIQHQEEGPGAMDGAGGGRLTTYQVAVQVFHRSVEPKAEAAMDHFDGVVDALCNRLRSDPRLGLTQAQADAVHLISGAYEALTVEFGEPQLGNEDGGWVDTWAVVRFPVLEWNQVT